MEAVVSVIALAGVTLDIIDKIQGFLQRARLSDRFAQDLLEHLQQAQMLLEQIRGLAQTCCPSSPRFQLELDLWSNVLRSVGYVNKYIRRLDHKLAALTPVSNCW